MNKLPEVGEVYIAIDSHCDVIRVTKVDYDDYHNDYNIYFEVLEDPNKYWKSSDVHCFYYEDIYNFYRLHKYYDTKLYQILNK